MKTQTEDHVRGAEKEKGTSTPPFWDTPTPLEPGEFPVDALPDAARALVDDLVRVYGVPPELPGMAALATLSAACARGYKLSSAVNGVENHANLYLIAGVPAGCGRICVDTVIRPLLAPVDEPVQKEVNPYPLPVLKRERTYVLNRLKLLSENIDQRQDGVDYSRDDAEIETMKQRLGELALKINAQLASSPALLSTHGLTDAVGALMTIYGARPTFYSPDDDAVLRIFGGAHRVDDKADFDLLLAGYTGSQVRIALPGRAPFFFSSPCLTLMPLVRPGVLHELFADRDSAQRGLLGRALCFVCDSPPREDDGTIAALDPAVISAWEDRVLAVLSTRHQFDPEAPFVIQCSAEAREVFRAYHNEIVKLRLGEFADLQDELTHCRENACRIALALFFDDNPDADELSGPQAEHAVRIARWAQYSNLALFDAARQAERANHAERLHKLLTANGGELTVRRLERHHGISKPRSNALCRMYPQSFALEIKDTGGRPSAVIRLIPTPAATRS
jgi:hypothetical protein